jgi:hypothetical protein
VEVTFQAFLTSAHSERRCVVIFRLRPLYTKLKEILVTTGQEDAWTHSASMDMVEKREIRTN